MKPYGYTKEELIAKHGDCFLFPEPVEGCSHKIMVKLDKIMEWFPKSEIERVTFDYGQGMKYDGKDEMYPMYYIDYGKKKLLGLKV